MLQYHDDLMGVPDIQHLAVFKRSSGLFLPFSSFCNGVPLYMHRRRDGVRASFCCRSEDPDAVEEAYPCLLHRRLMDYAQSSNQPPHRDLYVTFYTSLIMITHVMTRATTPQP